MTTIFPDADEFEGTGRTSGIQKVIRLMQALTALDEPQSLADLADRLEMPRPTVHRLLAQLEDAGVAQRDLGGKGYTAGPIWLRLAVDALATRARQPLVRGIMRKLVDTIGESCNLGILQNLEILYLERVECDWPLRMQLQAGSRVPLHCTASGKLMLAQMKPRQRARLFDGLRLERFTNKTFVDPAALDRECEAIGVSGVSVNREEYHLGLIGVAVPVMRSNGTAVAALAVHAPSFRMSVEAALDHVPILREAAREIAVAAMAEEDG